MVFPLIAPNHHNLWKLHKLLRVPGRDQGLAFLITCAGEHPAAHTGNRRSLSSLSPNLLRIILPSDAAQLLSYHHVYLDPCCSR
jgi:hypothetical protein